MPRLIATSIDKFIENRKDVIDSTPEYSHWKDDEVYNEMHGVDNDLSEPSKSELIKNNRNNSELIDETIKFGEVEDIIRYLYHIDNVDEELPPAEDMPMNENIQPQGQPEGPSEAERKAHEVNHMPFANWCDLCQSQSARSFTSCLR